MTMTDNVLHKWAEAVDEQIRDGVEEGSFSIAQANAFVEYFNKTAQERQMPVMLDEIPEILEIEIRATLRVEVEGTIRVPFLHTDEEFDEAVRAAWDAMIEDDDRDMSINEMNVSDVTRRDERW